MMNHSNEVHVSFNSNKLILNNIEKTIELPNIIKQIEEFDWVIIVRVDPKNKIFLNENIFGISYEGKVVWQIQAIPHIYNESPYIGMSKVGRNIKLLNWDGTDVIVNPNTGDILEKRFSK